MQIVYLLSLVAVAAVGWMLVSALRRRRLRANVARATNDFVRNCATLAGDFRAAANVTGKPRGLRWKECIFQSGMVLARDRANGEWLGLVPVTIRFEAISGGGMEDVEAVGNLRAATALLTWTGREWTTTGRAIFNLEPRDVLDRYKDSLEPIVAI